MTVNLIITRGLKKLAYGRFLSISRFRKRMGQTPAPSGSGILLEGPDWSYPDGTPGEMNKGQTGRYERDQEFARVMVDYGKQFKAIEEMRNKKKLEHKDIESN